MARLPNPGSDDNTWGNILNEFLDVAHNPDGTLEDTGIIAAKADDSTVIHNAGNETIDGVKTFTSSPIVPTPTSATDTANKSYVDSTVAAGAPDASTSTKGISKLSVAPTVAANPIAAGDNDPRLSNTRTPTDGSVTDAKIVAGGLSPSQITGTAVIASQLVAHEADTTNIHGIADTANLETSAGAQAKVDAHVNDTSDAHNATAISFAPAGTITATNVQAAIQEVASEASAGAGNSSTSSGGVSRWLL